MTRRLIDWLVRAVIWLRTRPVFALRAEHGQTTAEYALVILGAAAVATLLITWASHSHTLSRLFDTVIGKVVP